MQQLQSKTVQSIEGISIPTYRFASQQPEIGIVHLGPGAFFRGHQAWYTHKLMQQFGGDWAISCVSMRSAGVSQALNPQDGFYTLAELDKQTAYEVIGSIKEVLVAAQDYPQVFKRLTASTTKLVSMTITEKGYCLNLAGELDLQNPDIQQDLQGQQAVTAIGLLTAALAERKTLGLKPFTVLSCDNVTDNGKKLRQAIIQFAQQKDPALASWLDENLLSPCTMVDSITPATDDALRAQVAEQIKLADNWPIKRESFVQWVIEDTLPADAPQWQKVGATLTSDVQGFENAKLRLLNCPHSTMAYIGVLADLETVHDAMQQPALVEFISQLILQEVIPSFVAPKELDVQAYSQDILQRFRNPAIRHLLAQIAWDGSQKLPMRIIPIVSHNLANNLPVKHLSVALAAWCLFCRKRYMAQAELVDPLAQALFAIAKQCNDEPTHDAKLFLSLDSVFPQDLAENPVFVEAFTQGYKQLQPALQQGQFPWRALA
ncbi:mannitol dehydrogenase domain-containing protein [Catenovulum agarivorans DS-2]|uniref:Mannitol dehydrogenase domain-containing protein n=1 Tax=Catenovulum agarivorans DS-2 TaxID=1328313 RepID=W7QAC3_9ALTE|nr:mannitol dehydrogenase family protein [Catenovulum agarivorans]EWH08961.1 mannitol dehydrogenase domain-containing protein [Catenovulum agarivorans DS-2]